MNPRLISCLLFVTGAAILSAAAPKSTEAPWSIDFSSPEIPAEWQGSKSAFSVVDGALRGVAAPDDSHGPSLGRAISARDLSIEFDIRFARPGYFLFLIDGDSQFRGQAHLLRFSISGGQIQLAQDRGDPASKLAQKKERDQRGGKRIPATPAQLADPAFYRIERIANRKIKPAPGQWQHARIELRGNQAIAFLDGVEIKGEGTVLDVPKSRVVFLIGQAGDVRIDNIKMTPLNRAR